MCAVLCLLTQLCPTLCDPMDCSLPAPLSMGVLQARILEWVAMLFPRGYSQPRDRTQVSHIAGRFSPAEPPGKPKNTGVGSLSLLQGIFLTWELNQSLLHCRWILYQLSHQGSPNVFWHNFIFQSSPVLILLHIHMHVCAQCTGTHVDTHTHSCVCVHPPFTAFSIVLDVLCNPCFSGLTHPVWKKKKKACLPPQIPVPVISPLSISTSCYFQKQATPLH